MNKLALFVILIASTFCCYGATEKACLIEIKKEKDIELVQSLDCSKGDYLSVYSYTLQKRKGIRMRAVLMRVCDLSQPFSMTGGTNAGHWFTCTLSGEVRDLALGPEARKNIR